MLNEIREDPFRISNLSPKHDNKMEKSISELDYGQQNDEKNERQRKVKNGTKTKTIDACRYVNFENSRKIPYRKMLNYS